MFQVGGPNERYCSYVNGDNCTVEFYYGYDTDGSRKVRVNQNPSCPEGEPPVLAYSLGKENQYSSLLIEFLSVVFFL